MNEHSGLAGDEAGVAGPGPGSQQCWRTFVASLLIVLGCVLAPHASRYFVLSMTACRPVIV